MSKFLFIGEKPSKTALEKKLAWRHGKLAAKQLFDALRKVKINPEDHTFTNLFQPILNTEKICRNSIKRIKRAYKNGYILVGMGKKVQTELVKRELEHIPIVHPAARGKIRKKRRYTAHIRAALINKEF